MNLQIRISAKDDQGQVLISVEKNRRESYKTNPKTAKQVFDSRFPWTLTVAVQTDRRDDLQ